MKNYSDSYTSLNRKKITGTEGILKNHKDCGEKDTPGEFDIAREVERRGKIVGGKRSAREDKAGGGIVGQFRRLQQQEHKNKKALCKTKLFWFI